MLSFTKAMRPDLLKITLLLGLCFPIQALQAQALPAQASSLVPLYRSTSERLIEQALQNSTGFDRLALMCDRFGSRFSGSESLEQAIDWALQTMGEDGFSNVRGESVEVPRWVRGNESLLLLSPSPRECPMLGLGGSVGTPTDGIEAEVLVVNSFEDLQEKADEARGRVVLFNAPFTDYGLSLIHI